MRKLLAFVLALCFAFLSVIPASADGIDDGYGWVEVLDYGSMWRNDSVVVSGNRSDVKTSDKFFYSLPYGMTLNYVDLVFDAPKITGISVGHGSWGFKSLTLTKISGNLWRAYGTIEAHTYSQFEIRVTNSANSTINIYSFRVLNGGYNVSDIGTYRWEHTNGGTTNSGSANTSGLPKTWTIPWYSESTEFILTIPNAAARKYDYIDVSFACTWASVNAISVTSNRSYIPYEYDYIEAGGGDDNWGWLCTTIRIDLTDFISEDTDVFVRIEGITKDDSQFSLQGVKGMVNIRYLDPELYWYQRIYKSLESMGTVIGNMFSYMTSTFTNLLNTINTAISDGFNDLSLLVLQFKLSVENKFDELISILSPDTTESDATADELAQRGEEIGNLNQQIGQMERPDVNSINTNITVSTSPVSLNALTRIVGAPYISEVFLITFIFMMTSYVLFGKR